MNGTRWYKLNKSNEQLEVFLEEHFSKLQETLSDKLFAGVISIGEIIFSAGLTFYLEQTSSSPPQILISYLPEELVEKLEVFFLNNANLISFVSTTASCVITFIITIGIAKGIVFLLRKFGLCLFNKEDAKKAYNKERYFYKKVMNDIVTGISLEKKAFELYRNIENSETQQQDFDLYIIYLMESVFYFNEAIVNMDSNDFLQINDCKNTEYTLFLRSINPSVLCNTFQACVSALGRIASNLEKQGQDTDSAINAQGIYQMYIEEIKKQMTYGLNSINKCSAI